MQKKLRLSVVVMMIVLVSFGTSVNATINTGKGTQQVVDPLMTNVDLLYKGTLVPFGDGMMSVESGVWITVGFGVVDSDYTESCTVSFQQHIEFLSIFSLKFYWDGELIQDLYDPFNPDRIVVIDELEDGSCRLLTLHWHYIVPPAVGEHLLRADFFVFGDPLFTRNRFVTVLPHDGM